MGSHLKKSIKLVISLALAKKSPFHLFIKKPRKSRFSKNKILSRKTKPSKNKPSGKVPQKIHSLFIFIVLVISIVSLFLFSSGQYDYSNNLSGAAVGGGTGYIGVIASVPSISSANITSSDVFRNATIDNITAQISSGANKDIFNWYLNSSSINVLNMPFEKVNSSITSNARDYSPNSYDGSISGDPFWNATGGFDGNASYELDGDADFISFSSAANIFSSSQGSWVFWFKTNEDTGSSGQAILVAYTSGSVSNIQRIEINGSSLKFLNKASSDNFRGHIDISNLIGSWHHVALTGGPGGNNAYVDGVQVTPVYISGSSSSEHWLDDLTENTFQISGHDIGGGQTALFNGSIDEVQIFNEKLTANQVAAMYNNQSNLITSSQTEVNDNWSYCVTPNNANVDGATVCSDGLVVLDHIPSISSVLVNTTTPTTNSSSANITSHVTVTDPTNDQLKLIYDWKLNDSSIAHLILPMEKINDSNSSNLRDYSQYSNSVTEYQGVLWNATGGFDGNGSYEFDGVNDYLNVTDSQNLNLTSPITISFWMATSEDIDVTSTWGMQMVGRGEYGDPRNSMDVRIRATGDVVAFNYEHGSGTNENYALGTIDIADGTWHHIAATWTGTRCLAYVDGSVDSNVSCTNTPGPFDEGFSIGKSFASDQDNFSGSIDEVMIFNQSLSSGQINSIFLNKTDLVVNSQTSGADNWSVCVTANDDDVDSATVCSSNLEVNDPPSSPVLVTAANASTQTNRSIKFIWNNSLDANLDDVTTYFLQFSNDSTFSELIEDQSSLPEDNLNDSNFTHFPDLNVDTTFYWRVKASDGKENSSWAEYYNFQVLSSNVISLPVSSVNFSTVNDTEDKNTTMPQYDPMMVSNDGNIPLNISINATAMFDSAGSLWQYLIGANETNSFLTAENSTWTNLTSIQSLAITYFWHENNSNNANRANLNLLVRSASDESGGEKSSTIYISSEASE